jgi:hypothetical protein
MRFPQRSHQQGSRAAGLVVLAVGAVLTACNESTSAPDDDERIGPVVAASMTSHPKVLASFNPVLGENPEGLVVPHAGAEANRIFITFIFRVQVMRMNGSTAEPYATIADPTNRVGAGLASDDDGNIYWAIGAQGPGTAIPGIYKIPPGGGIATLFSAPIPAALPNGIAIVGKTAYWTDAIFGAVNKTDLTTGATQPWLFHPLLVGDPTACGGGEFPAPLGANGIVHVNGTLYITNSQFGRVVRVPIGATGLPGTVSVLAEDCDPFFGADGIAAKNGQLYVAVQPTHSIVRVDINTGKTKVLYTGAPLDRPSSPFVWESDGQKRLLVTNLGFGDGPSGPSLVGFKHND